MIGITSNANDVPTCFVGVGRSQHSGGVTQRPEEDDSAIFSLLPGSADVLFPLTSFRVVRLNYLWFWFGRRFGNRSIHHRINGFDVLLQLAHRQVQAFTDIVKFI